MAIMESIKSGVDFTVDTVSELAAVIAEKNRIRSQLNYIKKVIKTDSATRDQAYIELGRFFYENMRENASAENEAICAVIDTTSERISKASLKYMELVNLQNETKLCTENTEKIKKIVAEKASVTAKAAKEKSAELVGKLGSLTSKHNTVKLVRNVDVENRIKASNEKIYYIMEALNDAINAQKKVSFQYFTYNVRKEQKLKHDGCTYVFSPYKLIWNGDYYYVVGYSEKHEGIGSFRVDRIVRCPTILEADAVQPPKDFDLNVYLNSMFRMYNGDRKQIELVCENDLMDAIIDKFGQDVTVLANDMKSFRAIVTTATGPVFYSWVFGFGGHISIKAPDDVKDEYAKLVLEAAEAIKKTQ